MDLDGAAELSAVAFIYAARVDPAVLQAVHPGNSPAEAPDLDVAGSGAGLESGVLMGVSRFVVADFVLVWAPCMAENGVPWHRHLA